MGSTYYSSAETVDVIVLENTTVDDVVAQGGIVGIAQNTVPAGWSTPVSISGIHKLPKATGFAGAAGAPARYSTSNKRLEAAGDLVIGTYAAEAGTASTVGLVVLDRERGESQVVVDRIRIEGAANSARTAYSRPPFPGGVASIEYATEDAPSSAAGGWALSVTRGATSQLSTATVDAEALTEGALTALPLAAAADRACAEGDIIAVKLVSDHADGVPGTGIDVFIRYARA